MGSCWSLWSQGWCNTTNVFIQSLPLQTCTQCPPVWNNLPVFVAALCLTTASESRTPCWRTLLQTCTSSATMVPSALQNRKATLHCEWVLPGVISHFAGSNTLRGDGVSMACPRNLQHVCYELEGSAYQMGLWAILRESVNAGCCLRRGRPCQVTDRSDMICNRKGKAQIGELATQMVPEFIRIASILSCLCLRSTSVQSVQQFC